MAFVPVYNTCISLPVDADGRYIYCYCKEDKGGDMVGCDNKECSYGE